MNTGPIKNWTNHRPREVERTKKRQRAKKTAKHTHIIRANTKFRFFFITRRAISAGQIAILGMQNLPQNKQSILLALGLVIPQNRRDDT